MTTRNVYKQLATMQDLAQGLGNVQQRRGNADVTLAKIDTPYAVETETEMSALDVTKFTRARVYSSVTEYIDYVYDLTDTAGIPSDTGPGTWVLHVDSTIIPVVKEVTPVLTDLVFNTVAEMQAGKLGITYTVTPTQWLTVQGEGDKTVHYKTAASGDVDLGGGVFAVELDKQTETTAKTAPRPTIVIYGDSITNQNIENDSYSARGYYAWANALMGNPFTMLSNQGVSGETTTQMLARLGTVTGFNCGFVWILGGTNDLGLTSLTGEQIFANLKTMYDACVANGSVVIASTITPTNTITTAAKALAYYTCNELIREYTREQDNIILADFARAYPDTTGALPTAKTDATIDGVHPSIYGAIRMGKIGAEALKPLVSQFASTLPTSNFENNSFAPNATMTGTTGTADNASINLGDIADDCRLAAGTMVEYTKCSKFEALAGEKQRVEWYSAGGTQGFISIIQESTSGWSIGDTVVFKAELDVNEASSLRNVQIFLNIRNGSNAIIGQRVGLIELYNYGALEDIDSLVIETTSITVPAGAVKIELQVRPMARSGVIDFGRFGLSKV